MSSAGDILVISLDRFHCRVFLFIASAGFFFGYFSRISFSECWTGIALLSHYCCQVITVLQPR